MPESIQPENIFERVLIFDTTLRDGAQSPGISLSTAQSLDIANQLNRLNVDIIEAGFPVSSPGNFEAVEAIARQVQGPIIAGLARGGFPGDIDSAWNAIKDSERPRIHTFVSTSDIHIEHQMQTTRENVLGMARAAVAHAKSYVDDVEFSPMDATRSDVEFTAEVCQAAIDEGATTINIPDTVGYMRPNAYAKFLGKMYELVPALGNVVLSVHCHDDLGLAVANSFAGIEAGARQVECAVNGLGERAGNAALEEIVMLLRTFRDVDGYDTGIDSRQLTKTSRMVSRYTGYSVQKNKAIIGANAFAHESGIHQDAVLKDSSTFEIMSAESVGMDVDNIPLGKQSGRAAVRHALKEEGVFKAEFLKPTFNLFKDLADQIGKITREQIVEIHEEAQRRQTNPYKLGDIEITSSSKKGIYEADVTVTTETGGEQSAVARNDILHTDIDGTISALYTALGEVTGTDYKVEDHNVDSIGSGKQTIGKAFVRLRINGETVTGNGLSLDTNRASAWAYLDAVRKAEEKKSH